MCFMIYVNINLYDRISSVPEIGGGWVEHDAGQLLIFWILVGGGGVGWCDGPG